MASTLVDSLIIIGLVGFILGIVVGIYIGSVIARWHHAQAMEHLTASLRAEDDPTDYTRSYGAMGNRPRF